MKLLTSKLLVLLLLFIVLLIAVLSVRDVIDDRLHFRDQALASVSQGLPGEQRLTGPVLVLPYVEHYVEHETTGSGEQTQRRSHARTQQHAVYVLPERLSVSGDLATDARRRGLFEMAGFVLTGHLSGRFVMPATPPEATRPDGRMVAGTPFVLLEVGDTRGLRRVRLALDGRELKLQPGSGLEASRTGVHAPLAPASLPADGQDVAFDIDLQLGGSRRFELLPLGAETVFDLSSSWPHPSFVGRFLPDSRSVGADGFKARWQTSAFSSQARELWMSCLNNCAPHTLSTETLAVALIEPVDLYALADRATKYGHLFIGLTFVLFALYEVMKKLSIHPVQYLLVGLALAVFFLLLLALSEHFGFARAYAIAAVACVALISIYVASMLRSARIGLSMAGLLALLYGALYGILQSEQNALLLGSVLVFAILAVVMLLTRRLNWNEAFGARVAKIDAPGAGPQNPG
ncbi:cell envelope integrity protein CreD [Methyloversatilis sp.]|uniref:cell envelope integrity protein CreD n=1 Tax=Methyloversatilis sp. TaxID=2569862 RepID=UPI0035B1C9FF